jgi:hypothetical protein
MLRDCAARAHLQQGRARRAAAALRGRGGRAAPSWPRGGGAAGCSRAAARRSSRAAAAAPPCSGRAARTARRCGTWRWLGRGCRGSCRHVLVCSMTRVYRCPWSPVRRAGDVSRIQKLYKVQGHPRSRSRSRTAHANTRRGSASLRPGWAAARRSAPSCPTRPPGAARRRRDPPPGCRRARRCRQPPARKRHTSTGPSARGPGEGRGWATRCKAVCRRAAGRWRCARAPRVRGGARGPSRAAGGHAARPAAEVPRRARRRRDAAILSVAL